MLKRELKSDQRELIRHLEKDFENFLKFSTKINLKEKAFKFQNAL